LARVDSPPSALEMKTLSFSEMLASTGEFNGAKTQNIIIIILTAVKTSNLE
jgi:hypothetical protein